MNTTFRAIRARENQANDQKPQVTGNLETCDVDELPPGEVVVRVEYSSINYKDALSLVGNRGVTKTYPHTPGIDAAGVVESAPEGGLAPGTPVIVSGYDLGMNTWGGYSELIRVPAGWVVPMPSGLTARAAMAYGTAGYTAALSVERLERAIRPGGGAVPEGPVAVSGASGGVGSVAVAMLAGLGYHVVASTGKAGDPTTEQWLRSLGASEVVSREELEGEVKRPLFKSRWTGAIDTTGGTILAGLVKAAAYGAAVTSCGLTQSGDLPLSVFPFILRGVQLLGVDSVENPIGERRRIWERIATDLRQVKIEAEAHEIVLADVPSTAATLLDGTHSGRTVVRVSGE